MDAVEAYEAVCKGGATRAAGSRRLEQRDVVHLKVYEYRDAHDKRGGGGYQAKYNTGTGMHAVVVARLDTRSEASTVAAQRYAQVCDDHYDLVVSVL